MTTEHPVTFQNKTFRLDTSKQISKKRQAEALLLILWSGTLPVVVFITQWKFGVSNITKHLECAHSMKLKECGVFDCYNEASKVSSPANAKDCSAVAAAPRFSFKTKNHPCQKQIKKSEYWSSVYIPSANYQQNSLRH